MTALYLVLFVAALVCFVLAAFDVAVRRLNLVALGLALWMLVAVLQTLQRL